MVSRTCGWCGRVAHMRMSTDLLNVENRSAGTRLVTGAFSCANCKRLSVAWVEPELTEDDELIAGSDWVELLGEHGMWSPAKGVGRSYPDVPKHIAEAASEAHECLSIGAHRAAVLLARSVVEATAKDKGITSGNLMSKIDGLAAQQLIRPIAQEQAHEIRLLGNDMAHGDFVDPVTLEETDEVVGLMGEILQEVYQAPAKLERLKAARLAKAQPSAAPSP